jgi:hypothetical protein
MRFLMSGLGGSPCKRLSLCVAFVAVAAALPAVVPAQAPGGNGSWSDVTVADYRTHLEQLDQLVANCHKQRNPEACNQTQVGRDDRVRLSSGGPPLQREVRYNWLRDLLDRAGQKEEAATANSLPLEVTKEKPARIDDLLTQAQQRLSEDWKQAGSVIETSPRYARERNSLNAILAQKEYRGVSETSARERFVEWLENRLADLLALLERFGSRSPWITFALRALLLVALCVGLVWALVRIERRSRIRLVPEPISVSGAPSAREWQLWLADAHTMASQDLWREAIHFLYWAAIARLESRRLWPADRARTPREYLELLPAADPRKLNLATLTRSFERTWYGGRDAGPSDFKAALKLAAELGVE